MVSFKHYHSFHFQPLNARLVSLPYQSLKIGINNSINMIYILGFSCYVN